MPGSAHVEARFDGPEKERAAGSGEKLAKAGEVGVTGRHARCDGGAEVIAFPVFVFIAVINLFQHRQLKRRRIKAALRRRLLDERCRPANVKIAPSRGEGWVRGKLHWK